MLCLSSLTLWGLLWSLHKVSWESHWQYLWLIKKAKHQQVHNLRKEKWHDKQDDICDMHGISAALEVRSVVRGTAARLLGQQCKWMLGGTLGWFGWMKTFHAFWPIRLHGRGVYITILNSKRKDRRCYGADGIAKPAEAAYRHVTGWAQRTHKNCTPAVPRLSQICTISAVSAIPDHGIELPTICVGCALCLITNSLRLMHCLGPPLRCIKWRWEWKS